MEIAINPRNADAFVHDAVKTLRDDPEKYSAVRASLQAAKGAKDRAKALVKFATKERELASLMPSVATDVAIVTVTTVTVTTVLVPDTAY
ncbi:MAG TPA: hypothetical protein VF618_18865 [Thermoanaerobaculia bacterium]